MITLILAVVAFVLIVTHIAGRHYKRMASNLTIYLRLPLPYGMRPLPPREVLSQDEYALYRKCIRMRILCYDLTHAVGAAVVYWLMNRIVHLQWYTFFEYVLAYGLFYVASGVLYFFFYHIPYERHMGRL